MKAIVLTLFFLLIAPSEAKIFSRCELASVLKKKGQNINPDKLGYWICIAYYASKYNTQAVDVQGSGYYGIFQIRRGRWCIDNKYRSINGCNKACSAFLDDDITDDIACIQYIMKNILSTTTLLPWSKNCSTLDTSKWSRGCKL